jgi:catechol 2,3-dioxygenase-like lactoylglutathione lyase family enzyme
MIEIDHIGIAVRDAHRSARKLAEILGAADPVVDGADNDMYRVDLAHGSALLFSTSETVGFEHIAFRVDESQFASVVERLHGQGMQFGNDPENTRNGKSDDPIGGKGRVYFTDENGHLFEIVC